VIYLTEELPVIHQGQVVIDTSNAGVILDGSRLDVTSKVLLAPSLAQGTSSPIT